MWRSKSLKDDLAALNTGIFQIKDQRSLIKKQIYDWLNKQDTIFVLDSNACRDIYGRYELIAGVGTKEKMALTQLNHSNVEGFFEMLSRGNFSFLSLSYEAKSLFHQLPSDNQVLYDWPEAMIHQPKTLIRLEKGGLLRIDSHVSSPTKLLKDIQSSKHLNPQLPKIEWTGIPAFDPYKHNFDQIMRHLYDGDIYEVNYCHCFRGKLKQQGNHLTWFQQLNTLAPKPFSAYVRLEQLDLLCFSPERFLRRTGSTILTQPIKGTFPVDQTKYGEKEIAENLMIVDLCRNDLARVCETGSIEVPELLGTYAYQNIKHLISTIRGSLKKSVNLKEIFQATFPMGSMTGAPKHSAMQIIEKTENFRRGIYSGTVGYVDEKGDFDLNVVIRSAILDKKKAQIYLPVGGALLYDSDARAEYEETLAKIEFFTRQTDFTKPE